MTSSLPAPSIVDRAKNWFRILKRRPGSPSIPPNGESGFLSNPRNFTISGGQLIDAQNYVNEMKMYYMTNVISNRDAVFELLEPYACLDATKDSSARHPPPMCHPKTRLKIRDRLRWWLVNENDGWRMLWVRGAAGTGKSAVAQSFGDSCEDEIFGASYFFSRTAGRNKLETVVPTIVCQLARNCLEYHSLIERWLAKDQLLLRSSPPVQFRKLIIEPFSTLQRQHPRKPLVIILDGLDECDGEDTQQEILDMITDAIRTHPDLPLRWLIFSRPEAHLKNAFSQNLECGREELIIDNECQEDVERYVKDRIIKIKASYKDIMPVDWPLRDELQELLDAVSGLFVYASTCLNYINDREAADPRSQLTSLLAFMHQSQGVVSRNPLAVLDLLYSQILDDVPPTVFKNTWQILAYMSIQNKFDERLRSAQALSNLLRLDRPTFYKAVRGLHSVMAIPESGEASESKLYFHHASFLDFLLNPLRSGKFFISEQEALADVLRSGIYWYEVDVAHFHAHDEQNFDIYHKHDSLPGLTWASKEDELQLSRSIVKFIEMGLFNRHHGFELDSVPESLLAQIANLDFRFWSAPNVFLLAQICRLDPSFTSIVRTEPSSPTDHQLLEYFNLVIENGIARPIIFPLRCALPAGRWTRGFFFIGHGVKSVIVCGLRPPNLIREGLFSLRCDQEPPGSLISRYQGYLQNIQWDEEKAKVDIK